MVGGQLKFGFVPAASVQTLFANLLTYLFHSLADTSAIQSHNDHAFTKFTEDDHGELHRSTRVMDLVKTFGGGGNVVGISLLFGNLQWRDGSAPLFWFHFPPPRLSNVV